MNKKLQKDLQKFWNIKTGLIVLIVLIASLIWFKYIAGLVLLAFFIPLTFITVRYSKMVPHISIETFTGTAIFMGYVFSPGIGFFYGVTVGSFSYILNSFVAATYLSNPWLAGLAAALAALGKSMGLSFSHAFIVAILIRTVVAYFWFGILGADPIERLTHQASQFLTNLIIYLPLLNMLYGLVASFV